MNELPNTPVPEARPESVFQIWGRALTRPNEQTYAELASSPAAKATTAYLWVFIASLIQLLLAALVQRQMYNNMAEQFGLDLGALGMPGGTGAILAGLLCLAPLGAVISTVFFAIWVAVVQWLAKMFGGTGTNDQLAYAIAAIAAPYSIIAGIFTLFSAIPYVGLCISGILFLAGLYVIVLQVMAIKGVNRISWGAAIGAMLIPGLVVFLVCACIFGLSFAALIPVIRETTPNFGP